MITTVIFALALVATLASAVLAVADVRRARTETADAGSAASNGSASANAPHQLRPSGVVWGGMFALFELFLVIWSALGLVAQDPASAVVAAVALTAGGAMSFNRHRLASQLPAKLLAHPLACAVVALGLGAVFAVLALEVPSNHDIAYMYPLCLLLEIGLVYALFAGSFFLFQRTGSAPGVLAIVAFFVGIAQYFVILFKTMPISPSDLFAINTAAAVAGSGYTYTLSAFCLYGFALLACALILVTPLGELRRAADTAAAAPRGAHAVATAPRPHRARRVGINLLAALLLFGGVAAHVTLVDYYNFLGIQVYTWRPLESYYRQGFLPSFISSAQLMVPPKPADYSAEEADALVDEYAAAYDEANADNADRAAAEKQFDEVQPTVITIMNETFSDLSIYQNMHADYEGPQFFKSLDDALFRGDLYVSAYGGGTCNTEWEYLTGSSMSFLGSGLYPYMVYNQNPVPSLAEQFGELGYTTTAMHPNHASNWNRTNVYEQLGFDQFLSIDDFEGADTLRGMVTDGATYDKILELLEENDDPQFIFDVTMQNHSGYNTGLVPAAELEHYSIDGVEDPEVNEYLSLIQQSDEDLEKFIAELRELDRPVIVVFFGDHQPSFPSTYNDMWFTDEDEGTHTERLWHTQYFVWANYDVAGNAQESEHIDTSTNYLGALMAEAVGAPLTNLEKAHLSLREGLPIINVIGYQGSDGAWHLTGQDDDSEAASLRNDLWAMQYRMLFDTGEPVYATERQTEANETNPNLAPGTTAIL